MGILAIDPGTEVSGWVCVTIWDGPLPIEEWGITENEALLRMIDARDSPSVWTGTTTEYDVAIIERFSSYTQRIGNETIDAIDWGGRFHHALAQVMGHEPIRMYRREVKRQLCGRVTARDADVRDALIERYGPGKTKAIGTKKAPGPLYGVKRDVWAALALAVAYAEKQAEAK